ncbi:ribosomal subunit interface protein [Candidatus Kaiserbacteria bacterium CG10_big_fil_rev_8_21_14_0_10_51_14]|uniref:Ribosomal subunit interface protein n=1 Tax=Candidatus Kaiserbacteria bacterium CG10_big_fil_rev_8_21_14_0_10_51_14 TaxID=1974610 RepID=A0A2H0UCD2_9BACT|nr:MAG: ribosomal subunit interface protein [Candidatus Kaiserbacteria bacterium CG10_big_fil_rev_8_21_14_0_10_51_14]
MDIRIKTTDYEITPEVSSYLHERIATLEKFLAGEIHVVRCEVEVGRDAGRPRHGANIWFAEIRVMQPGMKAVYARNNAASVNAAIDDVKEEVERQLLRDKKLHTRVLRKTGASVKRWMRFGERFGDD